MGEAMGPGTAAPGGDRADLAAMGPAEVILSFDVEEHFRIEAAAGLRVPSSLRSHYADRMASTTRWLLDRLGERGIRATFFVLGQVAEDNPALVRAIHGAGHEVASHGWDHRRVLAMDPESFREDVRRSKEALEQATGAGVVMSTPASFSRSSGSFEQPPLRNDR